MAKEICISSTPHETRLAILEDDQLAEIYYERENEYTLAGSVYKGRVTRVLPGMQSAFVDIGLERDAFLYVTDFLEMEDQEDTDEVERASAQGDTQRPQYTPAQSGSAQAGTAQAGTPLVQSGPNQGQPRAGRDGRGRRDGRGEGRSEGRSEIRRSFVDGEPQGQSQAPSPFEPTSVPTYTSESMIVPASVADATARQDETEEQGARRLRGRRRRRGGRGRDEAGSSTAPDLSGGESTPEDEVEDAELPVMELEAAASRALKPFAPVPPAAAAVATPFLLPGESLGKYGNTVVKSAPSRLVLSELPPDTSDPLPDRTVTKPSTLIEDEIVWDGTGLFPGESLARHRQAEPSAPVHAEPSGVFAESAPAHEHFAPEPEMPAQPVPFEFSETLAEGSYEETSEETAEEPVGEPTDGFEEFEEESYAPDASEVDEPELAEEIHAESGAGHEAELHIEHSSEHESDEHPHESASHNVDPLPPSSFRLKDLFGGRKKEEEPAPPAPVKKIVPAVSAYSPGEGLVEEEVIEDEEYEFTPLKAHHGDEHDLEEMEEETLQQQIRSGALGEMLQEAHLDHRILIESEDDDDSDEESNGTAGASRPAAFGTGGRDRGGDRTGDRGGRGRSDRGNDRTGDRGGRSARPGQGGDGRRGGSGMSRRTAQTSDLPIISDLLKPGQEILVQIAKEPIAKKGARITSHIALPGRFLVFMPTVSHVGVSRKIASDEERQRLKRILVSEKGEASGGFIVRTAAEGATEEELRADLRFLINLWNDIKQRADTSKPPALIYHDLNLIERILRDQVSDNFSHIWVDSEADYERIVRFLNRFSPELVRRVKLYTKEIPLFEHFGIQEEISKALRSKVWLKSGGSIVINQTEALVAIDINTGKFVGKTARLEDTILKTNLDSIPEIVRQIRLRDLGGIIVIDFIDMDERKNRTRVMAALEEALKQDRAPTKVLQFNDFGLVAITRKRVKQSLERTLSVPCPVCQATGMVKSAATVANEIYIEMRKMRKHFDQSDVMVRVNPETAKALKSNNAKWLTELEDLTGKNVLVKSDATLHPEQFDIQG
jgi:ribonuclease G